MAETPLHPGEAPGTPRWVKIFGWVALVLVVLFAVLHLTGLHPHGHAS